MFDRSSIWARRTARAACLLLLGLPLLASATPVRWVFANARFADGGTITGRFTYDADTNVVSNWNVSVAGGNTATFPPITYDTTTSITGAQPLIGNTQTTVLFYLNGSPRTLRVTPVTDFTNAGGTVAINLNTPNNRSGGLECFNCGPAREITSGSFIGTPVAAGFSLSSTISGNWYDPAQSGHGFQIEVLPGGIATAFWFAFDNNGNQVWINAVGPLGQDTIAMQAGRVLNGRFPPNFNPNTVTRAPWGTLTFTFNDCDHGTVAWTTTDPAFTPSGTMTVQRLTTIDGLNCIDD